MLVFHFPLRSYSLLLHITFIPRLTEQNIAKTDRNSLGLDVVVQRSLTELTANARLLETTEWKLPTFN